MSIRSFISRLCGSRSVSPYARISASNAALALLDAVGLPVCPINLIDPDNRTSQVITYYFDSSEDAVKLAVWWKLRSSSLHQGTSTVVTLKLRDVYKALIQNEPYLDAEVRRKHASGVYGLKKTSKAVAQPAPYTQPVHTRIGLDAAYLTMARTWARRSKAQRLQVGAILVKDTQIISDGYNGMPYGAQNDVCEVNDGLTTVTRPEVLHAESNALLKLARYGSRYGGVGAEGATLYVTHSPCVECAKLIIQARIKRVVFAERYRIDAGCLLLGEYGIQVEQINLEQS